MERTRPRFPVERDRCIRALGSLLRVGPLPRALQSAVEAEVVPARDAYLAADSAYARARSSHTWKIRQAHAASAVFVRAFRRWVGTVTDEGGSRASHKVAVMFEGVLPGQIPELPHIEQLRLTAWMPQQIEGDGSLLGDPVRFAELWAARAELWEKVEARELQADAQVDARAELMKHQKQFDGAWGTVVRLIRRVAPEHATKIPVFVDRKRKGKDEEDEAPAQQAAAETAEAPQPEEPRAEEPKAEEPRAEEPRAEEPKAEASAEERASSGEGEPTTDGGAGTAGAATGEPPT